MAKIKSLWSKINPEPIESPNDFIVNHFQHNHHNDTNIDSAHFDPRRRAIFLSLLGLHRTWRKCPSIVLYTAIFILPLKRNWIYHSHSNHLKNKERNQSVEMNLFLNLTEIEPFIKLLKWKDSQNLLFCALDDYDSIVDKDKNNADPLIHSFWFHFSERLSTLYDTVSEKPLRPLPLRSDWWSDDAKWSSNYDAKAEDIICELYFVTLKFHTMKEILYQSNPTALLPVTCYHRKMYHSCAAISGLCEVMDPVQRPNWVFTDYDPYDMDNDEKDDLE